MLCDLAYNQAVYRPGCAVNAAVLRPRPANETRMTNFPNEKRDSNEGSEQFKRNGTNNRRSLSFRLQVRPPRSQSFKT